VAVEFWGNDTSFCPTSFCKNIAFKNSHFALTENVGQKGDARRFFSAAVGCQPLAEVAYVNLALA
jgi:hypothetical protein